MEGGGTEAGIPTTTAATGFGFVCSAHVLLEVTDEQVIHCCWW
jgi:hypothetical protein